MGLAGTKLNGIGLSILKAKILPEIKFPRVNQPTIASFKLPSNLCIQINNPIPSKIIRLVQRTIHKPDITHNWKSGANVVSVSGGQGTGN